MNPNTVHESARIPFTLLPFNETFGTQRGRWLSNRLRLSGKGAEKFADSVSSYFWNLQAGLTGRKRNGNDNSYLAYCRAARREIVGHPMYTRLPKWVREQVEDNSLIGEER